MLRIPSQIVRNQKLIISNASRWAKFHLFLSLYLMGTFSFLCHTSFCIWCGLRFQKRKLKIKVHQRHALWTFTLDSIQFVYFRFFFIMQQYDRVTYVCSFPMWIEWNIQSKKEINLWIRALYTVRCTITTIRWRIKCLCDMFRILFDFIFPNMYRDVFVADFNQMTYKERNKSVMIELDPLNSIDVCVRKRNETINVENTWNSNEKKRKTKYLSVSRDSCRFCYYFYDVDNVGWFDCQYFLCLFVAKWLGKRSMNCRLKQLTRCFFLHFFHIDV